MKNAVYLFRFHESPLMLELTTEEFLRALNEATEESGISKIDKLITRFSSFCFKEGEMSLEPFPEEIFKRVTSLMHDPAFQKIEESHRLLIIFEYDWGRLTEIQKADLLIVIEKTFDKYNDWMSHFVISELLGEYYCNNASLQILRSLKSTSNDIARSLVPHGFEHIVKSSSDVILRKQAMSFLISMKTDPSPDVRKEVEEALNKISTLNKNDG